MSLRSQQDGAVLRLTLDRPEKRNAFDEQIIAQLAAAYLRAGSDESVGVVVLQASGSHFSAGGDLAWMQRMAGYSKAENLMDAQGLADMLRTIDLCPKPTLARVQGSAYAGAVGLLAACDMVVAVPEANFAVTEVTIGLIPAVISPYLVRAMGVRQARRWCMTAESFTARQAQTMNLVHEIAAADQLDQVLDRQLDLLSRASPQALSETKALLAYVYRPLDAEVASETARRIADRRASADAREGIAAFLEKRRPAWRKTP